MASGSERAYGGTCSFSSLRRKLMRHKKSLIAMIAIVSLIVVYLGFKFVRVAYYNRGTAHMAKAEYDQAIRCFDKAIKISTRFAQAYCNRGTAYYEKGQYDRAILDFDKAIEIDPRCAEAYCNRAVAYYQRAEYDKARQDVGQAQTFGSNVDPTFLAALREASETER